MNDSRTANSIRNIMTGFLGQGIQLVLGFVNRLVFIRCLNAEYLGVNGLFTNILSMLSLAELGIGTAIVYELYRPLAQKDEKKIASLMKFYQKAYCGIGLLIAVAGMCIIPFLNIMIAEPPKINENLVLIYCIFLFNTASSYFFSYKSSILTADQKSYLVVGINYIVVFVQSILQIAILLITRNFILYLICQSVGTLTYNIIISRVADKRYPSIRGKNIQPLDEESRKGLFKNIKALVIIKIGGVLVNSTDNIIISSIKGLATTGLNSNYTLLLNTLNSIFQQIFNGITASVGNLNAVETNEKKKSMFKIINFLNFWLFAWCTISFIILANDIVSICFGSRYLLGKSIVVISAINFYVVGMQNAVWTYKTTMGLFDYGKYLVVGTGVVNIILSIVFGKQWGLFGILLATFISRMLTNVWYDPYAVFKYGFENNPLEYFGTYVKYIIIGVITFGITNWCSEIVTNGNIINFIWKLVICIVIPNIVFIVLFHKREEFIYLKEKIQSIIGKLIRIGKK